MHETAGQILQIFNSIVFISISVQGASIIVVDNERVAAETLGHKKTPVIFNFVDEP